MQSMTLLRAGLLAGSLVALHPARAAAQASFEGVITLSPGNDMHATFMTMWIKDGQVRSLVAGKKGAAVVHIVDRSGRILTVMNTPRGGVYMVTPSEQVDSATATADLRYIPTGQRETVAGYPCAYYRLANPDGLIHRKGEQYCITTALGFAGIGVEGTMSAASKRAIRQQFKDGYLILKTTTSAGGKDVPVWEATRIERTAVSDTMFVPPAGYTEIKMPGGRRIP